MYKSTYLIKGMDCPSEKSIIEMKLLEMKSIIKKLDFDFTDRKLIVFHTEKNENITTLIDSLKLWSSLEEVIEVENIEFSNDDNKQKKLLLTVLAINFTFFLIEITFWILSNSMWLIADSLDMLSDASIYMVSLFAIWWTIFLKKKIAKIAWYIQMTLAIFWLMEVVRRFIMPEESVNYVFVIIIASLAFLGNLYSMYLFTKNQSCDAHMKASQICTSNDLIANTWIIISWILIYLLDTNIPDLIIWAIVFAFVFNWSFKMIKLSK